MTASSALFTDTDQTCHTDRVHHSCQVHLSDGGNLQARPQAPTTPVRNQWPPKLISPPIDLHKGQCALIEWPQSNVNRWRWDHCARVEQRESDARGSCGTHNGSLVPANRINIDCGGWRVNGKVDVTQSFTYSHSCPRPVCHRWSACAAGPCPSCACARPWFRSGRVAGD